MGKETWAREIGYKLRTPGPGQYTVPDSFNDGPKFTIRPLPPVKEHPPSPGYYDPHKPSSGPKYSIGSSREEPRGSDVPGPSYIPPPFGRLYLNINSPKRGERRVSPRKPIHQSYNQSIQGPGAYNLSGVKKKGSPMVTIGSKVDSKWMYLNNNPGAGEYDVKSPRSGSPSYSFRTGDYPDIINDTPGPGEYSIDNAFKSKRPIYIHTHHFYPEPFNTPGPGKYSVRKQFGSDLPRISIRNSGFDHKPDPTPGPDYDTRRKLGRNGYIISPKKTDNEILEEEARIMAKKSNTPGPAAYDIRRLDLGNGHKLPQHMSPDLLAKELERSKQKLDSVTPGPGYYNIEYKHVMPTVPSYTISGDSIEPTLHNVTPGPDHYKPVREPSSPKWSIRNKRSVEPTNPTKDAGYYLLPGTNESPSWTIGRKEELNLIPV